MSLTGYAKIHQMHHRETQKMRGKLLTLQEKIDGSQISFGRIGGKLFVKSHKHMIDIHSPPKMFAAAIGSLSNLALPDSIVFRGEYLNKPKHNTLTYDRVPERNIIIYDIEVGDGTNDYMSVNDVEMNAALYGFEVVPTFLVAEFDNIMLETDMFEDMLKKQSVLGGTTIEGIVVKCYSMVDCNDKILMAKYVSPKFKEMNGSNARVKNTVDIVAGIAKKFNTVARYEKAVQHLREDGQILDDMTDIGPLMRELNSDFENECVDDVKDMLYKNYRKKIMRGVTNGFPEWYKARLLTAAANEPTGLYCRCGADDGQCNGGCKDKDGVVIEPDCSTEVSNEQAD